MIPENGLKKMETDLSLMYATRIFKWIKENKKSSWNFPTAFFIKYNIDYFNFPVLYLFTMF